MCARHDPQDKPSAESSGLKRISSVLRRRIRPVPQECKETGFALLLVLWTLTFLALIGTHVLTQGHNTALEADERQAGLELAITADAAIRQELYAIALGSATVPKGGEGWSSRDDEPFHLRIHIQVERSRINPGIVPRDLLNALMVASGVPSHDAARAAMALFNWRRAGMLGARKNVSDNALNSASNGVSFFNTQAQGRDSHLCTLSHGMFHSLDDLASVPGVGMAVVQHIAQSISFAQIDYPILSQATPEVRTALLQLSKTGNGLSTPSNIQGNALGGGTTVIVEVEASNRSRRMLRRAEVMLAPDAEPEPWKVMRWETLPAS